MSLVSPLLCPRSVIYRALKPEAGDYSAHPLILSHKKSNISQLLEPKHWCLTSSVAQSVKVQDSCEPGVIWSLKLAHLCRGTEGETSVRVFLSKTQLFPLYLAFWLLLPFLHFLCDRIYDHTDTHHRLNPRASVKLDFLSRLSKVQSRHWALWMVPAPVCSLKTWFTPIMNKSVDSSYQETTWDSGAKTINIGFVCQEGNMRVE